MQVHVDIRLRGLKHSGASLDRDGFRQRAHFESEVGAGDVIDENVDILLREGFEAGRVDRYIVRALRQVRNRIITGFVGIRLTGQAGGCVPDRHGCLGDHGICLVRDSSDDGSVENLS